MLFLKYLLMTTAVAMLTVAATQMFWHMLRLADARKRAMKGEVVPETPEPPFRRVTQLAALAIVPFLIALTIAVVPSGMAGVRVSQISGTKPGTLYPGVHFVTPLMERIVIYDVRDKVFSTATSDAKDKGRFFAVQSREGLPIGMAMTVRYRLDARRLDSIHQNLGQSPEQEIVPTVITSTFRDLSPSYTVRELFAVKREEVRTKATARITAKLAADGIVVKEVMLRDIQLPPEYAKGLETLLLKEQENDRMGVETEIQAKQVKIAELQAEANRVQEVKQAEGSAQVRVLHAKGEADAMKYTLPLKEKQIQQSRLESEARKEATIKDAEAAAQAKVIDSKAELERRNLLAQAEAHRIRITAVADSERMQQEAAVLKQNPLLINKIIAERLSDKVQIMMVPTDGKFFFNDVLRSPFSGGVPADDSPDARSSAVRAAGQR